MAQEKSPRTPSALELFPSPKLGGPPCNATPVSLQVELHQQKHTLS